MLLPLDIPPGVFRNGTEYQSAGRWRLSHLVRWYGAQLGPIGGWRTRTAGAVSGAPRAMRTWRTSASDRWIAIGTHTNLYVQSSAGTLYDITPLGLTTGQADESANVGFGAGPFGAGAFGTARPDTGASTPASVWDLDTFGSVLVGCLAADGKLYKWDLDPATRAAAIAGAPTGCAGCFSTAQGFLMAYGVGGDPRRVAWSDQGDATSWTPGATNQAGDVRLITQGTIVRGLRVGPLALILTDVDAHVGQYVGLPYIYSFEPVGSGCGAISKGCVVPIAGGQAVWWSLSGFWRLSGLAQPVECEVWDYLVTHLNQAQRSKVTGFHNSRFGEVWWFYPSIGSIENDSYVYWDYRRDHWGLGALGRTAATEESVFRYPLAMSSDGRTYEHEAGADHDGQTPAAETGPVELGGGDDVMECSTLISDDATAGDVQVTFRTRLYPDAAQTDYGPYAITPAGRTDARFEARQVRMRVDGATDRDWRFGRARLDVKPAGQQ